MSPKQNRKKDSKKEELPILLVHEEEQATRTGDVSKDVIEEIENNVGGQMQRISSYNFWNDDAATVSNANVNGIGLMFNEAVAALSEESRWRHLGELMKLKQASDEISIDMDEMQSAMEDGLPPVLEENEDLKVMVSGSNVVVDGDKNLEKDGSTVVKCTSNEVHQTRSRLLRSRPRSRLLDPVGPDQSNGRSGRFPQKSGQQKSVYLSGRADEDEEDPFLDVDLPPEYKKINISKVTIAESISLVLIITALICSLKIPVLRKKNLWDLELWKWEVLVLVLICGRLVSAGAMRVVVFLIMRNFLLRKRVLYFVYGLRNAVQNCVWLGLVLLTWHFLFDKRIRRENHKPLQYVTKILVCFLLGTLIWLVKTLIVKVLASYFHVSTFFDRIHESLFNQYVIETLSGPPLVEMQRVVDEEARLVEDVEQLQKAGAKVPPELKASVFSKSGQILKSDGLEKGSKQNSLKLSGMIHVRQENGMPIEHFNRLNPKNISAWNMKLLINIVRYDTLTTLDDKLQDATQTDEKQMQIRSEVEAKAAAKKIFHNVAKPGSKFIKLDDLMRFMEEEEAKKTLCLFEGASETCRISKSSLRNWVVKAFRERKSLSLTLNDTKTAVKRLHQMLNVIVIVVIGLIWLIILGVTTRQLIYMFGTQLVLCAFIFGNTLKNIFEALVYLFIVHPFDVGDRCEIDGKEYIVEEMNILSTVFLRDDNLKVTYMNNWLQMKAVHNFYRSPDMGESIDFCVHIATPAEKIAQIKQRITSYIDSKRDTWSPPMVVMRDVVELDMVKYSVWLSHTINFQDMGERFKRRAQLVEELVKILKELDLEYRIHKLDNNAVQMPRPSSARLPPTWAPSARN